MKKIDFAIKLASLYSKAYLKLFNEKNSLIIFLFHRIVHNEKEIQSTAISPTDVITTQLFRQFIEYYFNHDYVFISPTNILRGLNNNKKYILITFDDGYYNNKFALPILEEYGVPAVFFISANNVKFNVSFWWDVLYRERLKQGLSIKKIRKELRWLKSKTHQEIEEYLTNIFGKKTFKPLSDIDRPFTSSELREFSKEKYVFLGNHTSDHAILTNYPKNQIKSQILTAQNTIHDITGTKPVIISYPDGGYSNDVIKISKEIGLRLGITLDWRKNYLPIDFKCDDPMQLGRFGLYADDMFIERCEIFRLDTSLYNMAHHLLFKSAAR